jgi:hypothetical protein
MLSSVQTSTVEALISPGCTQTSVARCLLRLRRRYGVYSLWSTRRTRILAKTIWSFWSGIQETARGAPGDIQRLAMTWTWSISATRRRAPSPPACPTCDRRAGGHRADCRYRRRADILLNILASRFVLISRRIDAEEAFSLSMAACWR